MFITRLKLKNWRNFKDIDVPLREYTYLLGANASGKSNFLDVFRFLRDISKAHGGGLQKAVKDRGGLSKLRCLHARQDTEVLIEVHLANSPDDAVPAWRYLLGFSHEGVGAQRVIITQEKVWQGKDRTPLINRPLSEDKDDTTLLTQSHLEQIQTNKKFRDVAEFFGATTYLHLVPQLLKYSDMIGGQKLEDDPFGQGFLERIAKANIKTRDARLRKIDKALKTAIPQFQELKFVKDRINGHPHLEANYIHHRPKGAWQREDQFSDGTLRLIGLLWSLLESNSLLLIEEPELSLNDGIVKQIPLIMNRIQRENKRKQQVIISTHSEVLLSNKGIDGRGVLLLEAGSEGTTVRQPNKTEGMSIKNGLSIGEVILPKARPKAAEQLGFDL